MSATGEIFERANEPYLVLNNRLEIICCNRAASKLLQAKLETQSPAFADEPNLRKALTNASRVGDWIPLRIALDGAKHSFSFDARLRRLRDEPAAHHFILCLIMGNGEREAFRALRDEVVRAHARSTTLEAAKKRLANVIEATRAGCWEWNLKSDYIWVNKNWRKMLGHENCAVDYDIREWRKLCHPDDVAKARKRIKAHLRDDAHLREFEIRLRHKDGHWIWIAENSRVVERDESGKPTIMAGTHIDITQRKMHERELDEKRIEAEAANIAKSQFLATMSHEIRTPMNGVLGMLDVVLRSPLNQEQQEYIGVARESANSLLRILNDILDFSKLEAGAVDIECTPYCLHHVIDQVADLLRPKAEEKGLKLIIVKDEKIPEQIVGDAARLRQILMNLVGNAIKFTEQGSVKVSATIEENLDSERFVIAVHDTGIGISNDAIPKLFSHFAQADSSTTRRFGGTGLGLVICKQLAELMGGGVNIDSVEGKGSTFSFHFPVCRAKCALAIERDTKKIPETPADNEYKVPSMRILAADDHPVNQQVLKLFLAAAGHKTTIVDNGKEALSALDNDTYDAIIMDIEMPVMDGVAATKAIRLRAGPDCNTPIIAVTANALDGDRETYLDAGMDDYVSKPFNLENIQAALSRVSKLKSARRKKAENGGPRPTPVKASAGR